MRIALSLVLLTGLALVSQTAPKKPQPAKPAVPVLKANAVFPNAVQQVTSASPKLGFKAPTPISSLKSGLVQVRKTVDRPIVAMAERDGWFFYATSIARDRKTGAPVYMISGYAIKRKGQRVIRWSVW
jgi:hypothetical protein